MREMATRQLAEKQAKKKGFWGGLGNFASDFGGAVVDMAANPLETGKRLASQAKETFVTPIIDLPKAFDPTNNMGLIDRANTAISGGVALADAITPFIPEGAMANSLQREAMNRILDAEAARYAASGGGAKYRGVLGIHGSPTQGLREIKPFLGSNYEPGQSVAWFWDTQTSGYDPIDAFNKARQYATDNGEVYVARFPRGAVNEDFGKRLAEGGSFSSVRPNMSREPGRVVGSVKLSPDMFLPGDILRPEAYETVESQMRDAMVSAMTPLERRRMAGQASLGTMPTARQLAEQQRRRLEAMNAMFGP